MSFILPGVVSGAGIAGASGQVQFNNAGAFGGANIWQGTNLVEIYSGTSPQELRLFNTRTDDSNGEWGALRWVSNVLEIGGYANGTGTARNVRIGPRVGIGGAPGSYTPLTIYAPDNAAIDVVGAGTVNFRSTPGGGAGLVYENVAGTGTFWRQADVTFVAFEGAGGLRLYNQGVAAAAGAASAVLYSEDNGSGKTRLMLRFPTGAAVQVGIEP